MSLSITKNSINLPTTQEIKQTSIDDLPNEMLQSLFSYLDQSSKISAMSVSLLWRDNVRTQAQAEKSDVDRLVKLIVGNLDSTKYSNIINHCNSYFKESQIFISKKSSRELNTWFYNVRHFLARYLKDLDKKDLWQLEILFYKLGKSLPDFADLPRLAGIYKNEDANASPLTYYDAVECLLRLRDHVRALEVAEMNPFNGIFGRSSCLESVADNLSKMGNYDKAIEVAYSITKKKNASDQEEKCECSALWGISKNLLETGNYDRAIEILHTVPNNQKFTLRGSNKFSAFAAFSIHFLVRGHFKRAFEVSKHLPIVMIQSRDPLADLLLLLFFLIAFASLYQKFCLPS